MAITMRRYAIVKTASGELVDFIELKNDLAIHGAANGLAWTDDSGLMGVFCSIDGGPYGHIGTVRARNFFLDDNLEPDYSRALDRDPFDVGFDCRRFHVVDKSQHGDGMIATFRRCTFTDNTAAA